MNLGTFFIEGMADTIIRKMTGHRSEQLERYKHLSPQFLRQTNALIVGKFENELEGNKIGTFLGTQPENEKSHPEE